MAEIYLIIVAGLSLAIWGKVRYDHAVKTLPERPSRDLLYEELLTSISLSVIIVYTLVPSLSYLLLDTIPDWTSLLWLKIAAVLGALGIMFEFYGRLVDNVSSESE